jgi:hypothetical protein
MCRWGLVDEESMNAKRMNLVVCEEISCWRQ